MSHLPDDQPRAARGDSILHVPGRNLRYAARRLRQNPGFTAVAILSLAVGIGANTAIFSLVNVVLLRDAPITDPASLVEVYENTPDFPYNVLSYPDYEDLRDATGHVFTGISLSKLVPLQIELGGEFEMLVAEAVTGNYFSLLGLTPHVGRLFGPADDVSPGAHPVVALSHGFWQRAFGGNRDAVGQELRLSGRAYTIVGVAPADYPGNLRGLDPMVYVPIMMIDEIQPETSNELEARGNHSLFAKARLRPGVPIAEAQVSASAVASRLREQQVRNWDPDGDFNLVASSDVLLFPPIDQFVRAAAWLFTAVVGLVLLLACTNLASFLLARAVDRRREIAIRLALGASRRTLVGQLLTESTLLGLVAGGAGIALGAAMLRLLTTADLPLPIPITLDLDLDATVLSFSVVVSLAAGLFLGLIPALQASRPDVVTALKNESTGGGHAGPVRWRNALVIAQVAISLVLLVGAGLFLRSFQRIQAVDPGFGSDPAAILSVMVPTTRFNAVQGRQYTHRLLAEFGQLPGVEAVGLIDNLHLNSLSTNTTSVNADGVEPPPGRRAHSVDRATVDIGFFETVGIPIVEGRNFTEDDRPDTPRVAIINEALARQFWPDGDAVGQMLTAPDPDDPSHLVVGVAADTKVRTLGETPRAMVYHSYSQNYLAFLTVIARTSGGAEQTALTMLAVGRELDPDFFVWETKTMERHIGIQTLPARLSAFLLSAFAVLALLLSAIGLYGVVSYTVARRTREVGIRLALGADHGAVVRMLTGSGIRLVAIGTAVGLVVSVLLSRLLSQLLFGVEAFDLATFLAVPIMMTATGWLAAYVPARRASRVNPVTALRTD